MPIHSRYGTSGHQSPGQETTVTLIDTDPGIDDAFALALAVASPELNLRYVTTVAGNTGIRAVTRNAALLLPLFDAPEHIVLARGVGTPVAGRVRNARDFHGEDGLGGMQPQLIRSTSRPWRARADAVQVIIDAARTHGESLQIIAVGPLTNIALALRQAPQVMQQIGRLIIMGGAVRVAGNVSAAAEFNFFADPQAAAEVINAGLPTKLIPLDVTQTVRCTPQAIRKTFSRRKDHYARLMSGFAQHAFRRQPQGFALHDPLAVAVALQPNVIEVSRLPLQIVTGEGVTAGMSLEDGRTFDAAIHEGTPTDVALGVDADAVLRLFDERVLQSPRLAKPYRPRPRIAVMGGANMDLVVMAQHLPRAGETVQGRALQQIAGGKGANQAVAAARAGAEVSFVGRVGRDAFGESLRAAMANDGIELSYLSSDRQPTGVALITVDTDGENQITVAPGANARLSVADVRRAKPSILDADVMLTQFESPMPGVLAALKAAKRAGVRTILNPSPLRAVTPALPTLVDVLVLNEVEAATFTQHPVRTVGDARKALGRLAEIGFASVVLTLGARGVVWGSQETTHHLPAHQVEALDTTAAGDTFAGYFAYALASGATLAAAVDDANVAAALCVQRAGAQPTIPKRGEVARFQRAGSA